MQEHYYSHPPRIERGWREYLVGVDGRVYLDMVNNVASVGHAHPRIHAAVSRQTRLLNTNSRFHYAAITEYGERLAALLPDELDTVFFVNSGSEAVDLAIRLAMAATSRQDIVAMAEAYHGWTYASDAVSTSIADNPNALETRPDWVHTVDAANSYRGRHRGPDAARYAPEAVERIRALAAAATRPRASSARRSTATPAASPCPTATCARSTPRCASSGASRSRTRCRSVSVASGRGSGVPAAGRRARHRGGCEVDRGGLPARRRHHAP